MRLAAVILLNLLARAGCVLPELQQAPEPVDADACLACASSSCAELHASCMANPACEALLSCALQCPEGDSLCVTGCGQESPEGVGDALALGDCTDASCASDCPAFDVSAP
jgi:hypothetical protein